jgi:hypothetical protein
MNYAKPLLHAVVLASLTLTACSSATGEVEDQVGTAQQAALAANALAANALAANALTSNALAANALTAEALTDPNAREVLKYVTGCALPTGDNLSIDVEGVTYTFDGQLGLAPEWGLRGGSCGPLCQQWVSACVISRLDFLGNTVEISLRGDNPGLATTAAERAAYQNIEATYYGNIFASPERLYACLPPGQTEIPRVCGPSIEGCAVDVVGQCEELCGPQQPDGSFPDCWVPFTRGDQGWTLPQLYVGSITVFLQP